MNSKKDIKIKSITSDLELQRAYIDELKKGGEKSFTLIIAEAFVTGMRDSGYKSTATAIDEFIDNSIQAQASRVDVVCDIYKHGQNKNDIANIAVIDDGHGMDPDMIRAAVMWGGTHRYNDRSGFGRYGFGLPSAAVSITKRYEVYSLVKGGEWYKLCVDLDEIASGKLTNEYGSIKVPEPEASKIPDFVQECLGSRSLEHGTVIVLVSPDRLASGFRKSKNQFEGKMMEHLGLIYRGWLLRVPIYVNGKKVDPVDPLFLDPTARFYDVGNGIFAEAQEEKIFEFSTYDNTVSGYIRMRFSFMPPGFQTGPGEKKRNERFNIMKENNSYLIVTRTGRQIDLVNKTNYQREESDITIVNYDRNWAIELDFDPVLDEEFGITVNKQQVTLSQRIWDKLQDEGIPIIVKGLRKRFEEDIYKAKGKKQKDEQRVSEDIMIEAKKIEGDRTKILPQEKQEKAQEAIAKDAEKQAKDTGKSVDEVFHELVTLANSKPFKVEFEHHPGAPFYEPKQYGPRLRIIINTAHRFYTDLYDDLNSNPRAKTALELLLFVLGQCEVQATDLRDIFYQSERQEWSKLLNTRLTYLDRRDSIADAKSAKQEKLEISLSDNEQ